MCQNHARRRGFLLTLGVLLLLLLTVHSAYAADTHEPWFGVDKALHFMLSFGAGAGSSLLLGVLSPGIPADLRFALAGALGSLPGLLKEIRDQLHPPDYFSYKDLTYDLLGAFSGAGFIYLLSG